MSHAEIVDTAAEALRRAGRRSVGLRFDEVLVDYPGAGATVLRARLDDPPHQPQQVIVKRANTRYGLAMEWAGLIFLARLPATQILAPTPLAYDPAHHVIVMTDLTAEGFNRVGDLLLSDSADCAEALDATQIALGRLNAAGSGKLEMYAQILARRPEAVRSRHAVNKLEDLLTTLPQVIARHLRKDAPRQLEVEIQQARRILYEPGPYTTLTHGDPTVGNLFYAPGRGAKFIDLETLGYRHALLDGCFSRIRYLHSVWAQRIPLARQRQLAKSYRAALVEGCRRASDDQTFGRDFVAACAAWLAALCSHLDRVAEHDITWGRAGYRARIYNALAHFVTVTGEYQHMPALRDTAYQLQQQLRIDWPATERALPTYPSLHRGRR